MEFTCFAVRIFTVEVVDTVSDVGSLLNFSDERPRTNAVYTSLFAILILTSCSKDDDNWIELNENNIVGNWSTGIKGSHKFLNFGDDDKGSFGIYSNADPISFQTFKYKVEDSKIYIYDVFPKGKSPYYLDCKISNNKLKIENGEESGTYEKLEY